MQEGHSWGHLAPLSRAKERARRARECPVALCLPSFVPTVPAPPPLCRCWKPALKWRNLTCHLLAKGSYPVPKVLSAWQGPVPKSWAHPPTPHLKAAWFGGSGP